MLIRIINARSHWIFYYCYFFGAEKKTIFFFCETWHIANNKLINFLLKAMGSSENKAINQNHLTRKCLCTRRQLVCHSLKFVQCVFLFLFKACVIFLSKKISPFLSETSEWVCILNCFHLCRWMKIYCSSRFMNSMQIYLIYFLRVWPTNASHSLFIEKERERFESQNKHKLTVIYIEFTF